MILKAVFPIEELSKLEKLLLKIENLTYHAKEEKNGLCMEVVFMGEAIKALTIEKEYVLIQNKLQTYGVSLAACNNAMKHFGLVKSDLIPAAQPVTSGVGQTIARQIDGWGAYWC